MKAGSQATPFPRARPIAWLGELVDRLIFWAFVIGLAWVPFWYGSNDWIAWGVNAILFPGLTLLFEAALLCQSRRHPVGIRSLAVPAILFVGVLCWIMLQLATWTKLPWFNPIWSMTSEALGQPVTASISVNRDLTTLALVRLITAASAFWLAVQLCRVSERARLLLISLGIIGGVYASLGLIALKGIHLPWLTYLPSDNRYVSATFINRDSYATYAGMGFIVMAGLVGDHYRANLSEAVNGLRPLLASIVESSGGAGAALLAGTFLILVALLLTGSRGALLSITLSLLLMVRLDHSRRRASCWERLVLFVLAVGCIGATVLIFGNLVGAKLEQSGIYDANRMAVYLLTLRSIVNAPLQGWGYGTFVDVFPMYRDRTIDVWGIWAQAHDSYLEVLQGLGVVFGSMLIICVVLLVTRCARGAMTRRRGMMIPAVGASVGVLIGLNALVDFGLQMPAVAITFMTILGAGVAQSFSSRLALED